MRDWRCWWLGLLEGSRERCHVHRNQSGIAIVPDRVQVLEGSDFVDRQNAEPGKPLSTEQSLQMFKRDPWAKMPDELKRILATVSILTPATIKQRRTDCIQYPAEFETSKYIQCL